MPGRVEDHTDDLAARSAECPKQFAVSRIPEIYSAIIGTAGQHVPCRVEGNAGNGAGLPREGIKQLTAGGVPEVDGAIGAAARQPSPRRVESHARNLAALPFERAAPPFEPMEQLAVGGVPKRYGAIEAASSELLKGRIEGDTFDRAVVPIQRAPQPDPGRRAPACSRPPTRSWHRRSDGFMPKAPLGPEADHQLYRRVFPTSTATAGHCSVPIAGIKLVGEPQESWPLALAL